MSIISAFIRIHSYYVYYLIIEDKIENEDKSNATTFLENCFGKLVADGQNEKSSANFNNPNIPNVNISPSVQRIESGTFENKKIMFWINLPMTIEYIGPGAFKNCKSLTWINLNNKMTVIEEGTFENCKKLKYVELPHNLKKINESAFLNCTSLTIISIPQSATEIDSKAFQGCENLTLVQMNSKKIQNHKKKLPVRAKIVSL
ncbi:hypothetical protein M9Y10_018923 [Tritrichomonas musculus]|uniref:Surface antigen BspA-like protein n=1 Tax=Tritrichomonas musculus TaxID=1915356 RepID=A0ABR2HI86_9EUKA